MSPVNVCIPFYETADHITYQASAAVQGKTFVMVSGNRTSGPGVPPSPAVGASDPSEGGNYQCAPAAAGGPSVGVAEWDAAIGEKVGVIREGIVPVLASAAAIPAGSLISSDAVGKGRITVTATDKVLGICMNLGGAINSDLEVLLLMSNVSQGT